MAKKIPGVINQALVYRNADDELAGVASLTLPDVNNVTEEIRALGTGGFEMAIDGQFDPMEFGLKFSNIFSGITVGGKSDVDLTAMFALQEADSETGALSQIVPAVAEFKGQRKGVSGGEIAPAAKLEIDTTFSVTYYKLEIDGNTVFEIDVLTNRCVIDGEDVMSEINKAIGRN